MNPPSPSDAKVSLEALLRLKRAERPSSEFWAEFDAGLRRKQLVAMVERRSVWQTAMAGLSRWSWVGLPAGAAAAGVFVWALAVPKEKKVLEAEMAVASTTSTVVVPSQDVSAPVPAPLVMDSSSLLQVAAVDQAPVEQEASSQVHWNEGLAREAASLGFRSVTVTSNTEPANHFVADLSLAGLSRRSTTSSAAAVPARSAPSAETDVSAWSDPKRARLMAYADTTLSSGTEDRLRASLNAERPSRRLSERALADSIDRLDMGGDRVTIRF